MSKNADYIILKNVRASFPNLFRKGRFKGKETSFSITLLLDPKKNADDLHNIETQMKEVLASELKGKKSSDVGLCLCKGEDTSRPEYEGYMVLKATSPGKPVILSQQCKVIESEDDSPIQGGCYVNAKIRLWAYTEPPGRRINCNLIAVQFAAEGNPFSGSHISQEEAIEGFEEAKDTASDDLDEIFA